MPLLHIWMLFWVGAGLVQPQLARTVQTNFVAANLVQKAKLVLVELVLMVKRTGLRTFKEFKEKNGKTKPSQSHLLFFCRQG